MTLTMRFSVWTVKTINAFHFPGDIPAHVTTTTIRRVPLLYLDHVFNRMYIFDFISCYFVSHIESSYIYQEIKITASASCQTCFPNGP